MERKNMIIGVIVVIIAIIGIVFATGALNNKNQNPLHLTLNS